MSSENEERLIAAIGSDVTVDEWELGVVGLNAMDVCDQFSWQTYVPESVRLIWSSLSLESRLVAFLSAKHAAYSDSLDD